MLENPMDSSVKRHAPPNQRNRGLNRRKSTDESERASNLHSSDGETNLGTGFRRAPSIDSSDGGSNKSAYESFHPRLIALNGCCASEASQLLHQRWKAAIHCYNDPTIDLTGVHSSNFVQGLQNDRDGPVKDSQPTLVD